MKLIYVAPSISFQTIFVQTFKIVVDSWKFSILLLYILWDDCPIFMILASNEHLQQELEYSLIVTAGEFQKCNLDVRTLKKTFFVWALLLIVHIWNSSPLRSNLLRLQCTCCTVPTTSARPHGSPLVWACQWPSSQPLSSPQLSHNNSLWA